MSKYNGIFAFQGSATGTYLNGTATAAAAPGGIDGVTVEDEGVVVGDASGITTLNFTGDGVTVIGAGPSAEVQIPSSTTSAVSTRTSTFSVPATSTNLDSWRLVIIRTTLTSTDGTVTNVDNCTVNFSVAAAASGFSAEYPAGNAFFPASGTEEDVAFMWTPTQYGSPVSPLVYGHGKVNRRLDGRMIFSFGKSSNTGGNPDAGSNYEFSFHFAYVVS